MLPAFLVGLLLFVPILVSCAPAQSPGAQGFASQAGSRVEQKTLVIGLPLEPKVFGEMFEGGAAGPEHLQAMVQRDLVDPDERGEYQPQVAVARPAQAQGTWQVFPDGRMDTTWSLRPNVRWHDGTPLTIDDVLFSWQVALASDVPYKQREAAKLMEDIQPLDAQTFVIHWKSLYFGGDLLRTRDFYLLPKHILEPTFTSDRPGFVNSRYSIADYIGFGPYKLVNWEPGSFAQVEAFDGFFGTGPRIRTITVQFIPDTNAELAAMIKVSAQPRHAPRARSRC